MEQITRDITQILGGAGCADDLEGVLDLSGFTLGGLQYVLPDGIGYRMTLSNVGDAVVVTGRAWARVEGECVRCLEPARIDIESDLEGYFAISEESNLEGMEEDEYEFVPEDGVVDLTPCVVAAILVEMPSVFLCGEDCKGLCPRCGCNRNVEECSCDEQIDDMNPFAVLKGFFDEDGEDGEKG